MLCVVLRSNQGRDVEWQDALDDCSPLLNRSGRTHFVTRHTVGTRRRWHGPSTKLLFTRIGNSNGRETKLVLLNRNIATGWTSHRTARIAPLLWFDRYSTFYTIRWYLCLPFPPQQVKPTWSCLRRMAGGDNPPKEEARVWVQTTTHHHHGDDCPLVKFLEISTSLCRKESSRHIFHTTSVKRRIFYNSHSCRHWGGGGGESASHRRACSAKRHLFNSCRSTSATSRSWHLIQGRKGWSNAYKEAEEGAGMPHHHVFPARLRGDAYTTVMVGPSGWIRQRVLTRRCVRFPPVAYICHVGARIATARVNTIRQTLGSYGGDAGRNEVSPC